MTALTCQICLEDVAPTTTSTIVITKICSNACPAVCCSDCFQQHIKVSLSSAFPGVLPKIKCPICLVHLHKSQWSTIIPDTTTICSQYTTLCEQACSFQSPCCHNTSYTHLPDAYSDSKIRCWGEEDANGSNSKKLMLLPSLRRQLPVLQRRVRRFARHRLAPREVINYIENTFGDKSELIFQLVLRRIEDEERRATLLLSYHATYKNTQTMCCGGNVCFNCKRGVHHENKTVCDENRFEESNCMLQCRGCQITLVKVDGCDSVTCVCGFSMGWTQEVQYRELLHKNLLPVDPFDHKLFDAFIRRTSMLRRAVQCEVSDFIFKLKAKRFANLSSSVRSKLRELILRHMWSRRYQLAVVAHVREPALTHLVRDHSCSFRACLRTLVLTKVWKLRIAAFKKKSLAAEVRKLYVERLVENIQKQKGGSVLGRCFDRVDLGAMMKLIHEKREQHYVGIVARLFEIDEDEDDW